jgi:5-methylcytosine-specific restriction endonuclease McrBC GTP-binding regulatory subunit McrB
MKIRDYVKSYNIPFKKLKSDFKKDFDLLYKDEEVWLGNLEGKTDLLENEENKAAVDEVIQKLKGYEPFQEEDTPILSSFVRNINKIVEITNRINNFKDDTKVDNGTNLKLYDFFNSVKISKKLQISDYSLNSNLSKFLPHLYSVIKHCQNPIEYPIYYKYWKNVLKEVLAEKNDYNSMCDFYKKFPVDNRHLNFGTYLGTIGIEIAKNIKSSGIEIAEKSKDYKYLTKRVINIETFKSVLDDNLSTVKNSISNRDAIYDSLQFKMEDAGFTFEAKQKPYRQNRDELELKFTYPQLVINLKNDGYDSRATKFYIKPLSDEPNCEIGFVTGKSSPLVTDQLFGNSNSIDENDETPVPAWTNKVNDTALDQLLKLIKNYNKPKTLKNKMAFSLNTILYGPPGTGKTYRLKNEFFNKFTTQENLKTGKETKKRYVFTTFHQSFSYEDFIEGIKPIVYENEDNPGLGKQIIYEIKPGLFRQIVKEADQDRENDYAIFIDEINRGNIANIFGELITLIEDDKRIDSANYIPAKLPYSNDEFGVPPNLYIIGTMNTADRSVEALDTALRRRFSFIEMNPDPTKLSTPEFKCTGLDLECLLTAINARIEKLLDKDYCIGHSYFMTIEYQKNPLEEIKTIFQNKILPLLQEYFYGDWGKILLVLGKKFVEKKENTIKFLSTDSFEDFEEYDEKPIYNFTSPSIWTLDSFKSIYE